MPPSATRARPGDLLVALLGSAPGCLDRHLGAYGVRDEAVLVGLVVELLEVGVAGQALAGEADRRAAGSPA